MQYFLQFTIKNQYRRIHNSNQYIT